MNPTPAAEQDILPKSYLRYRGYYTVASRFVNDCLPNSIYPVVDYYSLTKRTDGVIRNTLL